MRTRRTRCCARISSAGSSVDGLSVFGSVRFCRGYRRRRRRCRHRLVGRSYYFAALLCHRSARESIFLGCTYSWRQCRLRSYRVSIHSRDAAERCMSNSDHERRQTFACVTSDKEVTSLKRRVHAWARVPRKVTSLKCRVYVFSGLQLTQNHLTQTQSLDFCGLAYEAKLFRRNASFLPSVSLKRAFIEDNRGLTSTGAMISECHAQMCHFKVSVHGDREIERCPQLGRPPADGLEESDKDSGR